MSNPRHLTEEELLFHVCCPLQRDQDQFAQVVQERQPRWAAFVSGLLWLLKGGLQLRVFQLQELEGVCLASHSQNETNALQPVLEQLKKQQPTGNFHLLDQTHLPSFYLLTQSIFQSFIRVFSMSRAMPWLCSNRGEYIGKAMVFNYRREIYRRYLKHSGIQTLLVANDHTLHFITLMATASELGIVVNYTQHAHVTPNFPPPHFFSNLYLDGQIAFDVYDALAQKSSNRPTLHITGASRYQEFNASNHRSFVSGIPRVGVAFDYHLKLLDDSEFLQKLKAICAGNSLQLRFHPRTPSANMERVVSQCRAVNMPIDHFDQPTSAEFLDAIDCLITGVSGIVLDAAVKGVLCLQITPNLSDYYGFGATGLAINFSELPPQLGDVFTEERYHLMQKALGAYLLPTPADGMLPAERIATSLLQALH